MSVFDSPDPASRAGVERPAGSGGPSPITRLRLQPVAVPALVVGGAVVVLLLASFFVQLDLMGAPNGIPVGLFLLLLALGTLAGLLLAFAAPSSETPELWAPGSRPAPTRLEYAMAGVAVLCSALAAYQVHAGDAGTPATIAWVAGITIAFLAAGLDATRLHVSLGSLGAGARRLPGRIGLPGLILLLIVLIAAALRLPALDTVPGFVHFDEAGDGLQARAILQGQVQSIFSFGYAEIPMLSFVWDALFFRLFGDNLLALRLSSATFGLASIVLVALLGKELVNWRVGLLAAAVLAFAHHHIHYSRSGLDHLQASCAGLLTIYFLIRTLRYDSRLAAVATGVALSLDVQVYYAGRVMLLFAPIVVAYVLLVSEQQLLRARIRVLLWIVLGSVVSLLPIGILFVEHWDQFASRTREVLILGGTPSTQQVVTGQIYMTTDPVYILRTNLWRTIQTFNYLGDTSDHFLSYYPILDPLTAALLPAALAYALFRVRRTGFGLSLLLFLFILIFGGMLTIDQPDWDRIILIIPAVALLVGALLDGVWQALERAIRLQLPIVLGMLACIAVIANGNIQFYFNRFEPNMRQQDISIPMDVGNYIRRFHDHPYVYSVTQSFYVDWAVVRFLVPDLWGCSVPTDAALAQCPHLVAQDRLFFIDPARTQIIPVIQHLFPGGSMRYVPRDPSAHPMLVYQVRS